LAGSLFWLGTLLKFVLVFLFLILPTVCMGASLPILVKIFVRDDRKLGRYVSILYGVNTLGAVLGAFAGSFFFIPKLGLIVTNHTAAVVNLLILGAAYLIQRAVGVDVDDATGSRDYEIKAAPSQPRLGLSAFQKAVLG